MRAVIDDGEWQTRAVLPPHDVMDTYKARDLMRQIAEARGSAAIPGMQFDTTINDWHTCPNTARINASNPCSEYMFLDDSACNLASINLMKFVREGADGEFDAVAFEEACRTMITAQEILVDNASYPTPAIAKNSHEYRPLGLGYANLGALLMSRGLPYDSDAGRDYSAAITALMHGAAYAESSKIARDHGGPFAGYEKNREPFLRVMRKHRAALKDIDRTHVPKDLFEAAKTVWDEVDRDGRAARLPQRPGDGAGADRDDRLHDGLRHHGRRAGHRAGQVQEAGRRRDDEDRQPDRADGAQEAGLQPAAGQGDHRVHRRARDDRGGAAHQGAASRGVRLRLQAGARRPLDPLHGPHQDDGRRAAVPVRRDSQDRQRAEGRHGRGDPAGLHRLVADGRQGGVDLPRRQQAHAAAEHLEDRGDDCCCGRRRGRPDAAASCRTSATRSPTSSTSPATRAT